MDDKILKFINTKIHHKILKFIIEILDIYQGKAGVLYL